MNAPRWNLDSIYPGFNSTEYRNAISLYDEKTEELESYLEDDLLKKDFPLWLKNFLKKLNECGALEESLGAYAASVNSTDTTDAESLSQMAFLDEKALRTSNIQLKYRNILSKHEKELFEIIKTDEELSKYRYVFEEEVFVRNRQMSDELENLAEDLQQYGSTAWSNLQAQIISNLKDETGKTFNEIRNEAYSEDRNVRKMAFKKEIELLKSVEIPLSACMNSIKGATCALNKRRNWKTPLEKALVSSRLSKKTLDSLIKAIEMSLPSWRKYLKAKAKILGLEKMEFCDLFAPLSEGNEKASSEWTYEKASEYIIEKFTSFSDDMGKFAKRAFSENWIDAEVRPGKTGGAFCVDFPYHKVSRVLSNFTGTFSDVITLSHELGHAYHHQCVCSEPYELSGYPMTLAETASNFAETIVRKDAIKNAEGFEKISLLEMHLQDNCQVLVDILCRFYFETEVFEKRQKGLLSAQELCSIMIDCQKKTYGDGLDENALHPYMWGMKCHYYIPDLDFYNFPYAFGALFSQGLYEQYVKEGASFADKYREILKYTGSLSCEDVCKKAGFDIESVDFWLGGIKSFEEDIDEFVKYVESYK